jgi:hypothetical protein
MSPSVQLVILDVFSNAYSNPVKTGKFEILNSHGDIYEKYSKPSLIWLQLIWMSNSPDRNMKNEKCCSQSSTHFKRHMSFRKADESLVCSDKTQQFLQTYITTFKNKYNF